MDRRAFITTLALGTFAGPQVAPAQRTRKVYRIGILGSAMASEGVGPNPRSPSIDALLRGLRELGYVYGEFSSPNFAGVRAGRSASLVSPPSWSVSKWT